MIKNLKPWLIKPLLAALILTPISITSYSCTTVFSNNKGTIKAVARTMDLYISDTPLIIVEPRGLSHQGDTGAHALKWTSKYGNVAITAFHSEAISDGINEKGLSAHLLYLHETIYPTVDSNNPSISNALWAKYILDNFATVEEALNGTKNLQIVATKVNGRTWPAHLSIEDATGDSAIIEYIEGQIKIYHAPKYQVMTNEPAYSIQLQNLKRYKAFGGQLSLPGDTDPLSRFVRVSTYLKTLPSSNQPINAIANVLSVIRTAMVPFGAEDTSNSKAVDAWSTRWVTVSDLTNKLYFFNSTSAPNLIWLDLNKINFNEGSKKLSIDPTDIHLEGDITNKLMS